MLTADMEEMLAAAELNKDLLKSICIHCKILQTKLSSKWIY